MRPEAHRVSPRSADVPARPWTGVAGTLSAQAYGPLVVVGLSHRTATVAFREQAALTQPTARALLGDLRAMPGVSAAAVLSTCNRTEADSAAAAPAVAG
jgi:hypothetical protein